MILNQWKFTWVYFLGECVLRLPHEQLLVLSFLLPAQLWSIKKFSFALLSLIKIKKILSTMINLVEFGQEISGLIFFVRGVVVWVFYRLVRVYIFRPRRAGRYCRVRYRRARAERCWLPVSNGRDYLEPLYIPRSLFLSSRAFRSFCSSFFLKSTFSYSVSLPWMKRY